jgi:predicted O-methyltransferase YrrM
MTALVIGQAVLCIYLLGLFFTYRHRFYLATARDQRYRIPTMHLADFDPRFRLGPHGPTRAAEIAFIGGADAVPFGTTDREAWVLGVLARDAHAVFEFGTATGKTAYLLARNSPEDALVMTLTLAPGAAADYRHEAGDSAIARTTALDESSFGAYLYSGTDVEAKVRQLYGDSKAFDHEPYRGSVDLVFIDGAHAYSYVLSDSRKAFEMLAPGGIIVWHDYKKRSGPPRDVYRALNQLAGKRRLVRLAGTHMVAHRQEWQADA